MRIMTWNIDNGGTLDLFNPVIANIKNIVNEIKKVNPDIVVIQEYLTEYKKQILEEGLEQQGYKYFKVCEDAPDKTLRKRVLIASKLEFEEKNFPDEISCYSRRNWCEICTIKDKIHILGVDVPLATTKNFDGSRNDNSKEKKVFLDSMLKKFIEYEKSEAPAVILGDFNLHSEAVYKEYLEKFDHYLCQVTSNSPTWGRNKFDYIYVNKAMGKLINEKAKFEPIETEYSDHKYLYIEFE